jgi:hypothetical protein
MLPCRQLQAAGRQAAWPRCCAAVTCLSGWLPGAFTLLTVRLLAAAAGSQHLPPSPAPLQANPAKPFLASKPTSPLLPYIVPPSTPHQQPGGHQSTTQMTPRNSAVRPSHSQHQHQCQNSRAESKPFVVDRPLSLCSASLGSFVNNVVCGLLGLNIQVYLMVWGMIW